MPLYNHEIETKCPWCREVFPLASNADPAVNTPPTRGDVMLCIRCGEWSVFTRSGKLRKPTDDEFVVIGSNPKNQFIRAAWVEIMKKAPGEPGAKATGNVTLSPDDRGR